MKDDLVKEAFRLSKELDKIRGYDSGLTEKMLQTLSEDELKDGISSLTRQLKRIEKRGR